MANVNYVKESIAFMEYANDEGLSANERLIWYALFHIFNKRADGACWPDGYISISNKRLLSFLPFSEDSLMKPRNNLAQRGLIRYKPGQKNKKNPEYQMVFFFTPNMHGESIYPQNTGNHDGNDRGNMQGNAGGNASGKVSCNVPDIKINLSTNVTQRTHTEQKNEYSYNDAWRTSARARNAVAQNILDRFTGQRDAYNDAHYDICDFLERGMTPEQIAGVLEECASTSRIPNHLFSEALYLGLVTQADAPRGY